MVISFILITEETLINNMNYEVEICKLNVLVELNVPVYWFKILNIIANEYGMGTVM